jgi:hypothetical protein
MANGDKYEDGAGAVMMIAAGVVATFIFFRFWCRYRTRRG